MKRRDFIKLSVVGAGVAGIMSPQELLARYQNQPPRPTRSRGTLFDKIWDKHVIADLGGGDYLMQVDRCIALSPTEIRNLLKQGVKIDNPQLFFGVPDHGTSTSPERYTNRSLGSGWQEFEASADDLRAMGFHMFGQADPRYGIQHVVGPETGLCQGTMFE